MKIDYNCVRQLVIVRPEIIYGKDEHGNMTHLYLGIKTLFLIY